MSQPRYRNTFMPDAPAVRYTPRVTDPIDQYIAAFPADVQAVLQRVRATIRKAAPRAEEAIKYKMPAYVQDGKNLVFFSGYKRHVAVYPLPASLRDELSQYAAAKGTARFALGKPLPTAAITKIVKARLKELPATTRTAKKPAQPRAAAEELPVLLFERPEAWHRWLSKHHASARGLWLKLAKKQSGVRSITRDQAVEGALIWGWIDGQGLSHDEQHFLIKFTPRGRRSVWSKINRIKVQALIERGEMKPPGLAEVERAQQDGRWDAAYDSPRTATVPEDLAAALAASPRAKASFAQLNAANRYAILWRLQTAKRAETRTRRLELCVAMLERGEVFHPSR